MSWALVNWFRLSSMSSTAARCRVLRCGVPAASPVLMVLALLGMPDGVQHDVGDVLVGELVGHLASAPDALDEVCPTQDAQVLADQGLGQAEPLDQLVDAAFAIGELGDERDADGGGERAEELAGLVVGVHGRRSQSHA